MKVSIIIPVIMNDQKFIEMTLKCLKHIGNTIKNISTEVIIIDNGSKLPAYFNTHIMVKNRGNIGYGPAINQGIKLSCGEYIIPMNNDVFVQDGWLEPLLDTLDKDKSIGVIRPVTVGKSNYGVEKRKFGQETITIDKKDYHGFCYVIPREVINKVGMFDEQFAPAYCEDMDMWVRITNAGYKMAKHFDSQVEHIGGVTGASANIGSSLQDNRRKFKVKWGFDVFSEEWYTDWKALQSKFGDV